MQSISKIFPFCAAALWILPQSSQAVDIEGTFTSDSAFPVRITDPSFYTLNGEADSGEIDSDTNLTVNGILSSTPSQNIITVAASSATAGNFTYNLELPASFWSRNVLEVYTPSAFSVENFTLNLRESATMHPNLIIYTGADSALRVRGGRLDLGMYGGMKGGSLMIMGYNRPSEAVFSATGTAADTEIGRVVFDTMSFYRGTVVFDLAETDGDFIQVDGAMTKVAGASPLVLELNVSAYDLQAWIEASERDEWSADLMSFATEGSNVSSDDFTLKLQDGITGKITISELDGISTITANLSIVPEPAAVAALIGAFAFCAAARHGGNRLEYEGGGIVRPLSTVSAGRHCRSHTGGSILWQLFPRLDCFLRPSPKKTNLP